MSIGLYSGVVLTLCGMCWRSTTAYYILRGTIGASMLPTALYAEAPIRLARRTIVADVASINSDETTPLLQFVAPDFVPLFTPIEDSTDDETNNDDDTTAPTAHYLLIPKDSAMINIDRAKRAMVEAQEEVLADILKETRARENVERQQLEDAQREQMLTDKLEYASRADQLREALMERILPSEPVAVLKNDDDEDDAAQSKYEHLGRILIPSQSIHADGGEPVSNADNGSENILYRKVVELQTAPFLENSDAVIVQRLDNNNSDDNAPEEDVKESLSRPLASFVLVP